LGFIVLDPFIHLQQADCWGNNRLILTQHITKYENLKRIYATAVFSVWCRLQAQQVLAERLPNAQVSRF